MGQRSATDLAMAGITHGTGDAFPDILHPTTVPLGTLGKPFPSQAKVGRECPKMLP